MTASEALSFPFVEGLTKREAKKVRDVWEQLRELQGLTAKHGMLLPIPFAAKLMSVSHQRVHQLIDAEKLVVVDVDGHRFVTADSISKLNQEGRKPGRPRKATLKEHFTEAAMRADLALSIAEELGSSERKK